MKTSQLKVQLFNIKNTPYKNRKKTLIETEEQSKLKQVNNFFFESENKSPLIIKTKENIQLNQKKEAFFLLAKKEKFNEETLNSTIINDKTIKRNNKLKNINKIKNDIRYLIIIIFFTQIILLSNNVDFIQSNFSKITLKINGNGTKNVFTSDNRFDNIYYPNIIYINGIEQNTIKYSYEFNQTDNNVELIWINNINYLRFMFYDCPDIIEIDLSKFNSSQVTNMAAMFYQCSNLISINFENFDTSQVSEMGSVFRSCSKLSSLNLSSFDTSKVASMGAMFNLCTNLKTINLINFDISNVKNMDSMFSGCSNLEYINLKNFIENDSLSANSIFDQVPDNVVICLNNNSNIILTKIKEKACYTIDCSDNWKTEQKKVVNKDGICSDNSGNDIIFKYEYKGRYYENCLNGNLMSNSDIQSCLCDSEKCFSCPNEPIKEDLCLKCNDNYYTIENDNYSYIDGYVKCYKDPIGYYLDKNESLYKKCFYTCKECEKKGDNITHNCLICDDNYPYEINISIYSNCYDNYSYYNYLNDEKDDNYIINSTYLKKYSTLLVDTSEIMGNNKVEYSTEKLIKYLTENIIDDSIKIDIKKLIDNIIKNITIEMTEKEESVFYDTILKTIEESFTSENYDSTKLDNGKDILIDLEKIKITLTTTQIQKNNINDNMTRIDLGDCESLIRNHYNLTNNQTLYMKNLEKIQEGMRIPKVEYDVYSKLLGRNLIKLNLSLCDNSTISVSIPVKIDDNLDILKSNSGYYNDICYTSKTESGTDISLKDRKNEYPNKTVCQDYCTFSDYNYTSEKAKCSCQVRESSFSFEDMDVDKDKLLENFKNVKNILNLNILVCYKVLLSKQGLVKNIGFYILITIISFHIASIFMFCLKQFDLLKLKILNIIYAIKCSNVLTNNCENGNNMIENNVKVVDSDECNNDEIKNDKTGDETKRISSNGKKKKGKKKAKRKESNKKESRNSETNQNTIINNTINNNFFISNSNQVFNHNKNKKNTINNFISENIPESKEMSIKEMEKIMEFNDDEINTLSYDLALLYDHRNYCQYYTSLIKTKHNFIFSFFYDKNYNCKIIQMDLFFIGFTIYYTVTALFYTDDTMHDIYINKGSFNIEYQLPKIIYSSLISMVLNILLKALALSNNTILNFKHNRTLINIDKRGKNLIKSLRIKFILFFIISFIFLLSFLYYLSMFGAVYRNTQYHLFWDTLISFGLSLLYPFGIYLFPGFFRIPALYDRINNKGCLYKFSKILQIF